MEVLFKPSFIKDARKLPQPVYDEVKNICLKIFPALKDFQNPKPYQVEKLRGFKEYYRIKIGEYRIGFKQESGKIIFIRVLNRKDIYRHFP